jgi:MarC family membrane protein
METTLVSATLLLVLVMDPFGNIPLFLSVLREVPARRRARVVLREMHIALGVLLVFMVAGDRLLGLLQVSEPALHIAGGLILVLIAVRMIFDPPQAMFPETPGGDPLIVPLAIPSIAGPSAIAMILILRAQQPEQWLRWLVALLLAWLMTVVVLLASTHLARYLGDRGLSAVQRLMGLILTVVAVDMALGGLELAWQDWGNVPNAEDAISDSRVQADPAGDDGALTDSRF